MFASHLTCVCLLSTALAAQATWRPIPELTDRGGHAMAYDPLRRVVVLFGGVVTGGQTPLGDTWEWDGSRWQPRFPATSPSPRSGHGMAFDPVGKRVLLFGGASSTMPEFKTLDETWAWDGSTWTKLNPKVRPSARQASMCVDPVRQRIVLFGGAAPSTKSAWGWVALSDTWEWDGKGWLPIAPATVPPRRVGQGMAFDAATKRVIMVGGHPEFGSIETFTWGWDGSNWHQMAGEQTSRDETHRLAETGNGRVLLMAGGRSLFADSFLEWDGKSWTRASPKTLPPRRTGMQLAGDTSRKRVVLFGGGSLPKAEQPRRDTWVWNGSDWQQVDDWPMPNSLDFAAAHDAERDQFVVVELSSGAPKTWLVEDGRFRSVVPPTSPPGNTRAQMIYHRGLRRVFAYGFGPGGDIWLWNGTTWARQSSSPSPSGTGLTYDGHRDKVILYSATKGELWEWDPQGWTLASKSAPRDMGMPAYDAGRRRVVLFGGNRYVGNRRFPSDETWEWDGARWLQLNPSKRPDARDEPHLIYMPALGGVVLFGGVLPALQGPGFAATDTWLWDGQSWQQLAVPANPGFRQVAYDSGRQMILGFDTLFVTDKPGNSLRAFSVESLTVSTHYPRPGQGFHVDIDLPRQAMRAFVLALSGANRPGIPVRTVPGVGVELLPLRPDALFSLSLAAGLVTGLDASGKARVPLGIPNDSAFVGLELHLAGASVRPGRVDAVTNSTSIQVIR